MFQLAASFLTSRAFDLLYAISTVKPTYLDTFRLCRIILLQDNVYCTITVHHQHFYPARSQKFAMGAVLGGLEAEPPAAVGQWRSEGEAPTPEAGGLGAESLAAGGTGVCKNNFILGLF